MKNNWYKDSVFYQIYPRSFCDSNGDGIGDINGIISKVDYLELLGIDAVWFSPLYCSQNKDYGYDITDYCNINAEYGTMEQFDKMVELLHSKNIKVIMDLVINHTSDQHKWFLESRSSKDNPYRDFYYWRKGKGKDGKTPPNNWESFFEGSAWQYDDATQEWYLHLFDKSQCDLNYSNPKVLEEIKNVLTFWLDKGVDGFRCDIITILDKAEGLPDGRLDSHLIGSEHYIDGPRLMDILCELKHDVLDKYDAFTVGESFSTTVDSIVKLTNEDNGALTTMFTFTHMSCDNEGDDKKYRKPFDLLQLKRALTCWQQGLYGKAWNMPFWENHDDARIISRYCNDTIYRKESAKLMATILLTLSGTPFIYQGQEIGMTSSRMKNISQYRDVSSINLYREMVKMYGHDKAIDDMSYNSRDNARTPMQWNDSHMAGFTSGNSTWIDVNANYTTVNVANDMADSDGVFNFYKKLIQMRKADALYRYGTYNDLLPDDTNVLCYERNYLDDALIVVANFSSSESKLCIDSLLAERYELVVSNYSDSEHTLGNCVLKPYQCAIYKKLN